MSDYDRDECRKSNSFTSTLPIIMRKFLLIWKHCTRLTKICQECLPRGQKGQNLSPLWTECRFFQCACVKWAVGGVCAMLCSDYVRPIRRRAVKRDRGLGIFSLYRSLSLFLCPALAEHTVFGVSVRNGRQLTGVPWDMRLAGHTCATHTHV